MASTANSFSSANGSPGAPMNNSRGSLRPGAGVKGDTGRRQTGGPADGGYRRNNPQRAWSQNTNPMGPKGSGPYSHQNGGGPNRKSNLSPRPTCGKESNTPDMHANDRLVFLLTSLIGLNITITTKTGEKFSGIFSGSSLEPNDTSFVLKMARRNSPEGDAIRPSGLSEQDSPYIGVPPEHRMIFEAQDIVSVFATNVSTAGITAKEQNGATSGFRTDSDISAGFQPGRERELQRWEPSSADLAEDMSLEGTNTSGWDQFEANATLFGATTSSYDENIYTTRIDRSDPDYKRKEAEAARIAREIEGSQTDNPHLREERGHAQENDALGEEERYSGVRRDETNFPPLQAGQPGKYMPPARRLPTGIPTIPGVPVDPAIVSAQIARPKTSEQQQKTAEVAKEAVAEPSKAADSTKAAETTKATPSGKPAIDSAAKDTSAKSGLSATASPQRDAVNEKTATHVGVEVFDQFKQFANNEKAKVQERRQNQASYDRTIKLNELMKFAQNFKLNTPVPKDLIPILAKDRSRQQQIVDRAQRQADDKAAAKTATAATTTTTTAKNTDQKPASRPSEPNQFKSPVAAPMAAAPDRQPYAPRGRQGFPPMGPHGRPPIHQGRGGTGMLSHRLADIQHQRKGAGMSIPASLPVNEARHPPTGPMGGDHGATHNQMQSPTSTVSSKFNVRAMEFKPNPAASTFTPAGTSAVSSSPASNARTRSISRAASPSVFFGTKKLLSASERPSLKDNFNPIKRMKKEAAEQSTKDFAFNGGIPPAYRTPPTWEVSSVNKDKTYADMFKDPAAPPSMAQQGRSVSNPPMPHQHQLPFHLQQGGHAGPQAAGPPHVVHPQQHHPPGPPHFDDPHRMQISASSSQAFPSPRLPHNHMAYQQSPMGHHAQLAMGQPVPPFYGHPSHMRHYPGGPQFVNPQNGMVAPMMAQQASSGPYMGVPQGIGAPYNPQMPMYSPNPSHAYPHVQPPPQPHNGYPSPSRGAPMMVHQGSQQGHPSPVMYMNAGQQHGQPFYGSQHPSHMPPRPGQQQHPHFSSSPHQGPHYPNQQQYRAQGNNFGGHGAHGPPPPMQTQGTPQGPPATAAHPPENPDDVK